MPSFQNNIPDSSKKSLWNLVSFLLAAVFAVLASNSFGADIATQTMDVALVLVSGILLILSILISARFGIHGNHGKAYLMFVCFSALWFLAELGWAASELATDSIPFPAQIDLFYLGAYPFLFLFSIFYLRPLRNAISKKILM